MYLHHRNRQGGRTHCRALLARRSVAGGQAADDLKIFVGITVVTGATRKEADEKHAEYLKYANSEAGLAHFASSTGIDFSQYDLDEPVTYGTSNASQSITQLAKQRGWTKRQLLGELAMGGRYPKIVGDGAEVADELASWIDEGEIDGFNLTRTVVPESYEDFIDIVVPALQDRGRYKTEYAHGSLRNKLFEEGDRLSQRHAGTRFG